MINVVLPVKGRVEEQHKFIVEYGGRDYPVREIAFQFEEPTPDKLPCVIKLGTDGHVLEIKQDYQPYLCSRYKEGQSYEFRVRSDHRPAGYYEVIDGHGFFTRLRECPPLEVGARIVCKVKRIRDIRLELEFQYIKTDKNQLALLGQRMKAACEAMGCDDRLVDFLLETPAGFAGAAQTRLIHDVASAPDTTAGLARAEAIAAFCLHVLEGSDLLRPLSAADRGTMQERLAAMADCCGVAVEAIKAIGDGRAEGIADSILGRLGLSGYLYNARHELRLLECLLALHTELADSHITRVFDVVCKLENSALRETSPFRNAFIRILENYIHACRHTIDSADSLEGDDDTQRCIYNAIEALAMQSLLGQGLTDPGFDPLLNRALLYRYLSYTKGANTEALLEKAYRCVAGEWSTVKEFDWPDVVSPLLMAQKAASILPTADVAASARHYVGDTVTLELTSDVTLFPTQARRRTLQNALPAALLPWHNQQVRLAESLHFQKWQDTSSLQPYKRMWNDVERHLFAPTEVARPKQAAARKQRPDAGETVFIRVVAPVNGNSKFSCRIEDEKYAGEGYLSVSDIVYYNPHASIDSFCDWQGRPYLFEAVVKSIDENDIMTFDLRTVMSQVINDEDYVNFEDDYDCVVTNYSDQYNSYACISASGLNFIVDATPDMPVLERGDFIRVRLLKRNVNDGAGRHTATYICPLPDTRFTVSDAFRKLMDWYANGEVYIPGESETDADVAGVMQADDLLSEGHVAELMKVIDRKAVTTTDYMQAYNYLGMARLIALLLANKRQADYYANRMKLIMMLQHFEANGAVEGQELREFSEMNSNLVENYRGLYIQFRRLQTVSFLRRADRNDELWRTAHEAKDPTLGRLAKLVLTYNLLGEFKLQAGQKGVHTKINELLNIKEKESDLSHFGEENLHTEFKTSIVFPPDNNMHDDLDQQTRKILEVVCGFLNAEGGTLYLGVNNEGLGVGLAADFGFRIFREAPNTRDFYDRYVIDRIRRRLGTEAAFCVNGEFIAANNRDVYRLTIKPCGHLVKLDGRCYRRIGSENIEVTGETLRRFEAEKAPAMPIPAAPAAPPEAKLPPIATATPQQQAVDSYPIAFLYFLEDNTYMLTSEIYRGPARLQLTINANNEDGCLVILYTDGTALRVPTAVLLKCKMEQHYTVYREKAIAFAALAHTDDLLLTTRRDRDRVASRFDTIENIPAAGLVNDKGAPLISVEGTLIAKACNVIPAYNKGTFKKITDLAPTAIGADLTAKSYTAQAEGLARLGIELVTD